METSTDNFSSVFVKFIKFCFLIVLSLYASATVLIIAVLRHQEWHLHLLRLLHRTWIAFVAEQMGSTSPAFVNSLLATLVGSILTVIGIGYFQGWAAVKKHIIETAAMGLVGVMAVLLLVYGTQFAWEVVRADYRDHQGLVAKANAPKPACPTCPNCATCPPAKVGPAQKELEDAQEKISGLEARLLMGSAAEPLKITPAGMNSYPTRELNKPGERHPKFARELIFLSNKVITPINLKVTCDHNIDSLSAVVSGFGVQMGGGKKNTDNGGFIGISSPAWTPSNPLLVYVAYTIDLDDPKKHDLTSCSFTQ